MQAPLKDIPPEAEAARPQCPAGFDESTEDEFAAMERHRSAYRGGPSYGGAALVENARAAATKLRTLLR